MKKKTSYPPQHRVLDQEPVRLGQLVERPGSVLGPDVHGVDGELVAVPRLEAGLERLGRRAVPSSRVRHEDHDALLRPASRCGAEEGAEGGADGGREGEGAGGPCAGELFFFCSREGGREGREEEVEREFASERTKKKKKKKKKKPPTPPFRNLLQRFLCFSLCRSLPLSALRHVRHERLMAHDCLTQSEAPTLPAKAFFPKLEDDDNRSFVLSARSNLLLPEPLEAAAFPLSLPPEDGERPRNAEGAKRLAREATPRPGGAPVGVADIVRRRLALLTLLLLLKKMEICSLLSPPSLARSLTKKTRLRPKKIRKPFPLCPVEKWLLPPPGGALLPDAARPAAERRLPRPLLGGEERQRRRPRSRPQRSHARSEVGRRRENSPRPIPPAPRLPSPHRRRRLFLLPSHRREGGAGRARSGHPERKQRETGGLLGR